MEFKVLMYGKSFVAEQLLSVGILPIEVPTLFPKDMTIDDLKELFEEEGADDQEILEFNRNISECEFRIVKISVV